ncbi:MAG TPA: DNA mismatch repair protein MutS, partial [Alkalispirochaeta sp.]|nr:DNA mismatch repair protein MutS [Alkalispirochaeta sp.]
LGMAVDHSSGAIVFLKKLRRGSEDRSYGVDVARMAGLPETVIGRARQILSRLEEEGGSLPVTGNPSHVPSAGSSDSSEELFTPEDLFRAELAGIDPEHLTPRQALDLIYRWKRGLPDQ